MIKKAIFSFLIITSPLFGTCPFCLQAVIQKQTVYEGQHWRVLVDHAPVIPGHLLAIPKRHVVKAHELNAEEWADFADTLKRIVKVFQTVVPADQYILIEKNGPQAGQTVPHVHFHILPFPSDKMANQAKEVLFAKVFGDLPSKLSDEELEREVAAFRAHFATIGPILTSSG